MATIVNLLEMFLSPPQSQKGYVSKPIANSKADSKLLACSEICGNSLSKYQ